MRRQASYPTYSSVHPVDIVVGNLGKELSSIKPSTMPDTYWITLQARLMRERAAVTG